MELNRANHMPQQYPHLVNTHTHTHTRHPMQVKMEHRSRMHMHKIPTKHTTITPQQLSISHFRV